MNDIINVALSIVAIFCLCFFVGNFTYQFLGIRYIPPLSQKLIGGISVLVSVIRIPYRENFPISIGVILVSSFALFGAALWTMSLFRLKRDGVCQSRGNVVGLYLIFLTLALLNPLFPLIIDHAFYYFHVGPDLMGHLISGSAILEGKTYFDYMRVFQETSNTTKWWIPSSKFWGAADFKDALNVEFMIMCIRYGHGIISSSASYMTGNPIWVGMLAGICFSLYATFAVMFSYLNDKTRSAAASFLLVICIAFSHSYVMMVHEGITAQIFALPLITFLLLYNIPFVLLDGKIQSIFFLALIVSALINTMSEAIPIFFGFTLLGAVYYVLYLARTGNGPSHFIKSICIKFCVAFAFLLVLSPASVFDYAAMTYMRHMQGFLYSGFGNLPWDIYSILFFMPYISIESGVRSLDILFQSDQAVIVLELIALLIVGFYGVFVKKNLDYYAILVGATLIALVFLTGVKYPLWKVTVILQPVIIFSLLTFFFKCAKPTIVKAILLIVASFVLYESAFILKAYSKFASKIYGNNFHATQNNFKNNRFVLVTPTSSGLYVNLAASIPFKYANSGWGPKFLDKDSRLPIGLYYTCDIEGNERCDQIKKHSTLNMNPGIIYDSNVEISTLLNGAGVVDPNKLSRFVESVYGIKNISN